MVLTIDKINKNCAPGTSGLGRYCGLDRAAKFWIVVRTYHSNKQEPTRRKRHLLECFWNSKILMTGQYQEHLKITAGNRFNDNIDNLEQLYLRVFNISVSLQPCANSTMHTLCVCTKVQIICLLSF